MLNVLITIITQIKLVDPSSSSSSSSSSTFALIKIMANSSFYFLPLSVAITASKRFNASPYLARLTIFSYDRYT
ncbi:hypothetical protein [Clostridium estertheticum]|uniref:hypothetical protein n=1 Tax=Clostridium estertheticum TaxID=238834 RepID=UPI0039A73DE7